MDMYTTDAVPTGDSRPVAAAWLVWAEHRDLDEALAKLKEKAATDHADVIVGLRLAMADNTYYVPYVMGANYNPGTGPHGGSYWAVYGTAVRFEKTAAEEEERKRASSSTPFIGYDALTRLMHTQGYRAKMLKNEGVVLDPPED